jgi:DNA-binding Lrp family transcriptional regulator
MTIHPLEPGSMPSDSPNSADAITSGDVERIALKLAEGRRIERNGDGRKTYCPLCRSETNRRRPRPTLSMTARDGTILVHCHRCKSEGREIIRELVCLGLLPDRFREASAAYAIFLAVSAATDSALWRGTGGATDQKVIGVLVNIVRRSGKAEFGASVREVAEGARVKAATVSRALRRLEACGWLEKVGTARGPRAAIWRLRVPALTADRRVTILPAGKEGDGLYQPDPFSVGGDRASLSRLITPFPHDAFRCGKGLGPVKGRIYALLAKPLTARQIATFLRYRHVRNVRIHLEGLRKWRLVNRSLGGLYERSDRDLDEVADELGVAGASERQRLHHQAERSRHRSWCEGLEHWKKTGELVDPDTGELFAPNHKSRTEATLADFRCVVTVCRTRAEESGVCECGVECPPLDREIGGRDSSQVG